MGCFLACFGSSKDRKQRKRRHKVHPRETQRNTSYNPIPVQSAVSSVQEYSEKPVTTLSEVRVKAEEQSNSTSAQKKVTFDANVKTYEHVLPEEVTDILPDIVEDGEKEKEENSVKSSQSHSSCEASSITSSSDSYPPNHRYQNCRESDDELDYEVSNLDDDDDDGMLDYEDMYEDDNNGIVESRIAGRKLDSKEIDSSIVTRGLDGEGGVKSIMSNRTARDRSGYVHSVLNPVENLTQWKAVKAKGKSPLKQQNENFTVDEAQRASFSMEQSFKELSLSFKSKPEHQSKKAKQEVAVDASLSNWLSSSETITPITKSNSKVSLITTPEKIMSQGSTNSLRSQEDRPILGVLTLEEINKFSASSYPRKSPSRSPDDMPIIGTVGTYWSTTSSPQDSGSTSSYKGIPNTTS